MVVLDGTGAVRAMVGGKSYKRSQFNRVTKAKRQPGSAFKPFLYSAALAQGVMPETLVDDLPLTAAEGARADWQPKNADGRFDGPISVREALLRSKNLVSLRLRGIVTVHSSVGKGTVFTLELPLLDDDGEEQDAG